MTTDLGLIVQAAQRDAHILALQRSGDGAAQRCLAHSGRAIEAEDGRLEVATHLEHGKVFEDALLDLLQAVVVAVEHTAGVLHIEVVSGILAPRETEHHLQVVELYVVVGRLGIDAFELHHLLLEGVGHLLAPQLLGRLAAQLVDVLILHAAAQLVLDILQLLLKEVFALLLVEVLTGAHLDAGLEVGKLHLAVEDREQVGGTLLERLFLQELHLLLHVEGEVRTHEVDQEHAVGDVLDGKCRIGLHVLGGLDEAHGEVLTVVDDGLKLAVATLGEHLGERHHLAREIGARRHHVGELQALHTLEDDRSGLVGHLEDAHHTRCRTRLVEVFLLRVLGLG